MKKKKHKRKIKIKIKIIYYGDSSYPDIPRSTEVVHSALCATIYRFSNDGPHFEAEIVDSQAMSLS